MRPYATLDYELSASPVNLLLCCLVKQCSISDSTLIIYVYKHKREADSLFMKRGVHFQNCPYSLLQILGQSQLYKYSNFLLMIYET